MLGAVELVQIDNMPSGGNLRVLTLSALLQVFLQRLPLVIRGRASNQLRLVQAVSLLLHHEDELLVGEH